MGDDLGAHADQERPQAGRDRRRDAQDSGAPAVESGKVARSRRAKDREAGCSEAAADVVSGAAEPASGERRQPRRPREEGEASKGPENRKSSPHFLRVMNLPDDMVHDEFKATVQDFGEVLSVRLEKLKEVGKVGTVHFKNSADVPRAMRKLHRRRVEGWEKRLAAQVVEP